MERTATRPSRSPAPQRPARRPPVASSPPAPRISSRRGLRRAAALALCAAAVASFASGSFELGACCAVSIATLLLRAALDDSPVVDGNDFEVVIRATKEMEYLLEESFRAPPTAGLHEKISVAQTPAGQPLPEGVVRRMRKLVTIRNQLVHDRGVNAVDRAAFRVGWAAAERELRTLLPADSMPFCVIS